MIIDLIAHVPSYRSLGPRFAAGFEWLAAFAPDTANGRCDIHGDDVYALVQSYETAAAADKKYESHRLYADIQFLVAGDECIFYAPTDALTAVTLYDSQKDFILYADPTPAGTPLAMRPGVFAIFLPQDGHKPGCKAGASAPAKKVVVKVRL
jgi:YhcH/YjgK/YiaL family protein